MVLADGTTMDASNGVAVPAGLGATERDILNSMALLVCHEKAMLKLADDTGKQTLVLGI